MSKELCNKLEDKGYCVIDRMFYMSFAVMLEDITFNNTLEDFVDQEAEDICKALDIPETEESIMAISEFLEEETLIDGLFSHFNKTGFVAEIKTPEFTFSKTKEGLLANGSAFSWDCCYSDWIYSETIEGLTDKAISKSKNNYKDQKDKFMIENGITHEEEN